MEQQYFRIPMNEDGNENSHDQPTTQRSSWPRVALQMLFLFSAAAVGFIIRDVSCRRYDVPSLGKGVVPRVPLGTSVKVFQYNSTFALPPPAQGGSEPIWDALLPDGLGYIRSPELAQNLSVISAFHQLHCLYTLRRAYFASSSDSLEDFDFGLNRTSHTSHCFEYLRQSIMCSADSSVEPAGDVMGGFLGWGFKRQCRDYSQLRAWAETWRAFDGYGFLARSAHT